jgi:ribulose-phosphate 3-epimerase
MMKIAPSILSADFARLADGIGEAEAGGADWIHVDVMDGHFVPNITIGPPVVAALRRVTQLPLDVHLMIDRPDTLLEAFARAGADYITVHQEASPHLHRTVQRIRELGAKPGVSINPATPLATLDEILPYVDMVLIMTVNPGFGGQQYIPTMTRKIADLRRRLDERGFWGVELEVDGGVSPSTIGEIAGAGATVFVAGAAIFNQERGVAENIAHLRHHATAGAPGSR